MKNLLLFLGLSLSIPAFANLSFDPSLILNAAKNYQGPFMVNPSGETRQASQVYLTLQYDAPVNPHTQSFNSSFRGSPANSRGD
jgi:hypothetical protein